MERKAFLRNSIGLLSMVSLLDACKKTNDGGTANSTGTGGSNSGSSACRVSPAEEEGPFPYPGGETTAPPALQRTDTTEGQAGVALSLTLTVVNINNSCAPVNNARVDIWQCNKDGYYSGYANQPGILGTQSYVGQTFLRGFQNTDAAGVATFGTIYPGWYSGRATHIHYEVYVGGVLKKMGQMAFSESISDAVHTSALYAAHGINTTRNATDHVFGDSATDLANETISLAGTVNAGYAGTYTIGIQV